VQPPTVSPTNPVRNALQILTTFNGNDVAVQALRTLSTVVKNIMKNPNEQKYLTLKKSNAVFDRKVGSLRGGPETLRAIGFTENDATWNLVPSADAWNVLMR